MGYMGFFDDKLAKIRTIGGHRTIVMIYEQASKRGLMMFDEKASPSTVVDVGELLTLWVEEKPSIDVTIGFKDQTLSFKDQIERRLSIGPWLNVDIYSKGKRRTVEKVGLSHAGKTKNGPKGKLKRGITFSPVSGNVVFK